MDDDDGNDDGNDDGEPPNRMTPTASPTGDPVDGGSGGQPQSRTFPPKQNNNKSPSPTMSPTESIFGQQDDAACSAHSSCVVTVGDCCPSPTTGEDLDCCGTSIRVASIGSVFVQNQNRLLTKNDL
jgi:hypothetical protein